VSGCVVTATYTPLRWSLTSLDLLLHPRQELAPSLDLVALPLPLPVSAWVAFLSLVSNLSFPISPFSEAWDDLIP
jgi:hypothetical protein